MKQVSRADIGLVTCVKSIDRLVTEGSSMKVALLCLLLMSASQALGAMVAERFPWISDLDQARALAAADNKPMLIVFRCEP